jgi:hypothetical protein
MNILRNTDYILEKKNRISEEKIPSFILDVQERKIGLPPFRKSKVESPSF